MGVVFECGRELCVCGVDAGSFARDVFVAWRQVSPPRSRVVSFSKSFLIKLVQTCKKKKKKKRCVICVCHIHTYLLSVCPSG